jgi:hypothetical protein
MNNKNNKRNQIMTIKGFIFNRVEKLGGKNYNHIGFSDDKNRFGEMLGSLVPEIGMTKKARLTIELIENKRPPENNRGAKTIKKPKNSKK